jgi:hypothetical protein
VSKTKNPVLMLDLDGVLCDFSEAFTRTARNLDPSVPIVSTVKQPSWSLTEFMSKPLVNATWDEVCRAQAWWQHEPFPLFEEAECKRLKYIMQAHEVVYCTSRSARNPSGPSVAEQSIAWLEQRGLRRPSLVVSKKKGEVARAIGATHALDDRPENVCMIHWVTDGACKSFVLDRPYNRAYPFPSGVVRVASLGEFFQACEIPNIQAPLDKHPSNAQFSFEGKKAA